MIDLTGEEDDVHKAPSGIHLQRAGVHLQRTPRQQSSALVTSLSENVRLEDHLRQARTHGVELPLPRRKRRFNKTGESDSVCRKRKKVKSSCNKRFLIDITSEEYSKIFTPTTPPRYPLKNSRKTTAQPSLSKIVTPKKKLKKVIGLSSHPVEAHSAIISSLLETPPPKISSEPTPSCPSALRSVRPRLRRYKKNSRKSTTQPISPKILVNPSSHPKENLCTNIAVLSSSSPVEPKCQSDTVFSALETALRKQNSKPTPSWSTGLRLRQPTFERYNRTDLLPSKTSDKFCGIGVSQEPSTRRRTRSQSFKSRANSKKYSLLRTRALTMKNTQNSSAEVKHCLEEFLHILSESSYPSLVALNDSSILYSTMGRLMQRDFSSCPICGHINYLGRGAWVEHMLSHKQSILKDLPTFSHQVAGLNNFEGQARIRTAIEFLHDMGGEKTEMYPAVSFPKFVDPYTGSEIKSAAISPYGHVCEYRTWVDFLRMPGAENICPITMNPLTISQLVKLSPENINEFVGNIKHQDEPLEEWRKSLKVKE